MQIYVYMYIYLNACMYVYEKERGCPQNASPHRTAASPWVMRFWVNCHFCPDVKRMILWRYADGEFLASGSNTLIHPRILKYTRWYTTVGRSQNRACFLLGGPHHTANQPWVYRSHETKRCVLKLEEPTWLGVLKPFSPVASSLGRTPDAHAGPAARWRGGMHPKLMIWEQPLRSNVQRFRGGLVFKDHIILYHSTLGLGVITKQKMGRQQPHTHTRGHAIQTGVVLSFFSFSYSKFMSRRACIWDS